MNFCTLVTFCCLATLSGCLSADVKDKLGELLQDLQRQELMEEITNRLHERQIVNEKPLADDTSAKAIIDLPNDIKPIPFPSCSRACCDKRKTRVRLGNIAPGVTNGMGNVVTVVEAPSTSGNIETSTCNKRALLKVNFEKFAGCPFCGRYLLRIDLELSREARSTGNRMLFNIGDSESNDGYKGDANHQKYDAELQGQNNDIRIYGNDYCTDKGYNPLTFTNALSPQATHVTIYVGNEYIRVTNDLGFDRETCHRCLYALNGQPDTTVNTDIYVALNQVVTGRSDRRGFGVCAATLSWVCGWNINENYKD